jgi:hypothetical protein
MTGSADAGIDAVARTTAARLCPAPVAVVARAGGGGNSRLYRVETEDGRVFALKSYPSRSLDPRDRLGTEFAALSFVARHDSERRSPAALARDDVEGFGLYEWVDGAPVGPPTASDIDAMLAFIARLAAVRAAPDAAPLPFASEACLSLPQIAEQIRRRRDRLFDAAKDHPELAEYMADGFAPALESALTRAASISRTAGVDPDADLDAARRTLSPSDFGFHNALRRRDGRLVFLDFEYFGWDDPVRLVGDVSWHPGMNLPPPLADRFVSGCRRIFADDPAFDARLSGQWPLIGLRWCAIILNEYLPERWAARIHAGQAGDRPAVLARQMDKARAFLDKVRRSLQDASTTAGDV